ncbi:hypothetical protein M2432_004337 [Mycobacterium sp. OTB74]|nr:hypothetical protein [Mycobacterium sp. OTB74]
MKVLRSDSDVIQRFRNQTRTTALPEEPIFLRIYKTELQSSANTEDRFHRLLEAADQHRSVAKTAGREWFVISTRFLDEVAQTLSLPIEVVNEVDITDDEQSNRQQRAQAPQSSLDKSATCVLNWRVGKGDVHASSSERAGRWRYEACPAMAQGTPPNPLRTSRRYRPDEVVGEQVAERVYVGKGHTRDVFGQGPHEHVNQDGTQQLLEEY